MIENATPLDRSLEIERTISQLTRTILLKLGCTLTDKTYHSLVQFPSGTLWQRTYVVSNTHYKIMLPDGTIIGAEYSRWLGLDGLYMIKIPIELIERYAAPRP